MTPGDLTVTQNGSPNMSCNVGVGEVWVPGSSTPTQGLYYARNGAAVNVPITASSPSLPRIDQIIVQVEDAAYAGAAKDIKPDKVTGTPTSGAALNNLVGLGAVPASSIVIAYVLVPANATTIVTADIANVAAQASRASGAWTALTLATNVFPGGYGPSARREGDTVRLKGQLSNNTGGSITVGTTWATIPAGLNLRPSALVIITGNLTPGGGGASTAAMLEITTGGLLSLSVAAPTNAFISLDGVTYTLS